MKPQATVHATSRIAFREVGQVIPTRRSGRWVWPVCGVSAVLGLFMLAGYLDGRAELQQQIDVALAQAERTRVFEEGRRQGHQDMVDSAQAAWTAAAQVNEARCARAAP